MQIERTDSEILIRVSANTDLTGLQRILDYVKFREIASKSKLTQKQIDELARESKSSWWEKNKSRFIK
jgi:predicted trehalose synthase